MVMVNLAFQLKSRGIAVGMVNPGLTDTDFVSDMPFPMRSAELAVSDMIRNIETINVDNTAAYINYNGRPVPWQDLTQKTNKLNSAIPARDLSTEVSALAIISPDSIENLPI